MVVNENYWGGEVNLREVYFKNYLDNVADDALSDINLGITDILLDSVVSNMTKVKEMDLGFKLTSSVLDQVLLINHRHPIIGTGVATPLGIRDPDRALEAARYVRQAINYAIPRQGIVDIFRAKSTPNGFQLNEDNPFFTGDNTAKQNFTLAREYMEKAGYEFPKEDPEPAVVSTEFIVETPPRVSFAASAFMFTLVVLVVLNQRIQLRRRSNS